MPMTSELRAFRPRTVPTDPKLLARFVQEELRTIQNTLDLLLQAVRELDAIKLE